MDKFKIKLSIPRIIRGLIQLLAFIFIPGLFISTFSAMKDVYSALITGAFSFSALSYQLLLLLAVVPITAVMGRFFCGYLCAFGSMSDFLWFISNRIHKRTSRISDRTDGLLKKLKYVILGFIVVLAWTFGIVSFGSTASPWTIFGMFASLSAWPSASYLLSVGSALLLVIMIGSLFIERFFCRYLCPLGAVYSILSLPRLFRIKKPRSSCGPCTTCTKECAMGIPLSEADQVTSGECINCFQCVDVCPRHNVKANPAPAVASTIAFTAITGMYLIGNLSTVVTASAASTSTTLIARSTESFTDGVYTGSASGFRGTTNVQVTVTNGEIEDIEILSTNDDSKYFSRAESSVINNILLSQSTDVPTVSGATFSSNAIINAVKNALESSDTALTAVDSAETSATTDSQDIIATPSTSAGTTTTANSSGTYTDGTTTGTGSGFRGTTEVSVTVSGGIITEITVVSYRDDEKYFSRAENTVISSIISQQSIDVSTVSGATFSSNGIIEAVANALSLDFTNPNSTLPKHGSKP